MLYKALIHCNSHLKQLYSSNKVEQILNGGTELDIKDRVSASVYLRSYVGNMYLIKNTQGVKKVAAKN